MAVNVKKVVMPSADKRWRIIDATMRRHGYRHQALIEALHSVQEVFGYIDEPSMRFVADALHVPLSKVYGVASFYHFFTLKPQGRHTCVICLGTACYIKGAANLIASFAEHHGIRPGETTADGELSLLTARCFGSCGLAPAMTLDGEMIGKVAGKEMLERVEKVAVHVG